MEDDSPTVAGCSQPNTMGDNYSIFTSWTTDPNVAMSFATGSAFGPPTNGIILEKRFHKSRFGVDIIRSEAFGDIMGESEWLVPGVQVTTIKHKVNAAAKD